MKTSRPTSSALQPMPARVSRFFRRNRTIRATRAASLKMVSKAMISNPIVVCLMTKKPRIIEGMIRKRNTSTSASCPGTPGRSPCSLRGKGSPLSRLMYGFPPA